MFMFSLSFFALCPFESQSDMEVFFLWLFLLLSLQCLTAFHAALQSSPIGSPILVSMVDKYLPFASIIVMF
jgi:hypothetical protein